jgi:hypothetical protein
LASLKSFRACGFLTANGVALAAGLLIEEIDEAGAVESLQ